MQRFKRCKECAQTPYLMVEGLCVTFPFVFDFTSRYYSPYDSKVLLSMVGCYAHAKPTGEIIEIERK